MSIDLTLCRHKPQTTPRKDARGEYRRCLDCGARLPWSWPEEQIAPRPAALLRSRLRKLIAMLKVSVFCLLVMAFMCAFATGALAQTAKVVALDSEESAHAKTLYAAKAKADGAWIEFLKLETTKYSDRLGPAIELSEDFKFMVPAGEEFVVQSEGRAVICHESSSHGLISNPAKLATH